MQVFTALIFGAVGGVASILLHQTLPPVGIALSLLISVLSIWLVGRIFGSRSYKSIAALGWFAIILKGATFGSGKELLLQGDGVGTTLLILGSVVVFATVIKKP